MIQCLSHPFLLTSKIEYSRFIYGKVETISGDWSQMFRSMVKELFLGIKFIPGTVWIPEFILTILIVLQVWTFTAWKFMISNEILTVKRSI